MALALARPRLYSQMPLGDESVPTALGLVFDTSLSMGYKEKDKTRLDEAKERARAILEKIPDSSLVFVVDSADPVRPAALSPGGGPEADRRAGHPSGQPAAERRDGPGLSGGRRVRPAAARGLRPDRPGPIFLEPRAARRGARPGREGQDDARRQDRDLRRPAGTPERERRRHRSRPSRPRPWPPRASRSRSGPRSARRATSPRAALVEFYLDGVKKDEKPVGISGRTARSRSASRPRPAPGRRGPPRRAAAQRQPRPARVQRPAATSPSRSGRPSRCC